LRAARRLRREGLGDDPDSNVHSDSNDGYWQPMSQLPIPAGAFFGDGMPPPFLPMGFPPMLPPGMPPGMLPFLPPGLPPGMPPGAQFGPMLMFGGPPPPFPPHFFPPPFTGAQAMGAHFHVHIHHDDDDD